MLSPEVIAQAEKRIGQTISGKWHLDRVIGVGGMAAVYEATHRNRNRVAIKLLHPILSLDEGTRHRFLREGYVANTIRHEGAVQILDDDLTEEGVAFLVMELLQGETVEDRMERKGGALEVGEALELTEQLLDVLCAAHDQGVIHRDIKPDNLFLTENGRLKVLDFGIARLHQGDTRSTRVGSFMGTPAYCAPEQARGRWDEVDARTDLFSVAATLFTTITGDHVHPAETSSEQLALAIGATARSLASALPGAPKELVEFVDKALAYEKDDRFQSARAMKAAIQKVRAGLKNVTIPPPRRAHSEELGGKLLDPDATTIAGEADSYHPPSLYSIKPPVRILIGLLAAGVLATFFLILAHQEDPSSRAEVTDEIMSGESTSLEIKTAQTEHQTEASSPDESTEAKAPVEASPSEAEAPKAAGEGLERVAPSSPSVETAPVRGSAASSRPAPPPRLQQSPLPKVQPAAQGASSRSGPPQASFPVSDAQSTSGSVSDLSPPPPPIDESGLFDARH